MNRMFFLAVVGLMAVGATGCATGVADPQPDPKPVTQSRGTPTVPFNASLNEPAAPITDTASLGGLEVDVPESFPQPDDEAPAADEPAVPAPSENAGRIEEQPIGG